MHFFLSKISHQAQPKGRPKIRLRRQTKLLATLHPWFMVIGAAWCSIKTCCFSKHVKTSVKHRKHQTHLLASIFIWMSWCTIPHQCHHIYEIIIDYHRSFYNILWWHLMTGHKSDTSGVRKVLQGRLHISLILKVDGQMALASASKTTQQITIITGR